MNIVNLTTLPIVLHVANPNGEQERIVLPMSGNTALAHGRTGEAVTIPGIPVPVWTATVYTKVVGLPAPATNTFYVVSKSVAEALVQMGESRPDVVYATGTYGITELVRATL